MAHIENLKSERATLETTTSSSTGTVTSPASGYFIHTVDGYENAVDTDDVEQLTVSDVRALEEGEAGSNADSKPYLRQQRADAGAIVVRDDQRVHGQRHGDLEGGDAVCDGGDDPGRGREDQ